MVYVFIRHEVQDYDRWRAAFDDALMMRRNAGEASYRAFRDVSKKNEVTILCDFDTYDHARRFLESEDLKTTMKNAGVMGEPIVRYMQEALSIRRTAAD